jgi:MFS family permease
MVVFGIGAGAVAPMYVLRALDLGATPWLAGMVVALSGLGMVIADLPAGRVVASIGERGAMAVGSVLGTVGILAAIIASNVGVLAVGILLNGAAGAVWGLARHSYLVAVTPAADLGRAMSTLTGSMRLGFFCGPFLGAAVLHVLGPNGALWLALATTVISGTAAAASRSPSGAKVAAAPASLGEIVVEHKRTLATLGMAALLIGAARAARLALLPLWAAHIGLNASTTSLVFGIAGAVDVLTCYPAGVWLDRYGRRAMGVPSMVLFALGFGALPCTSSGVGLSLSAVLLGLANGLSNGLVLTVGADVAPEGQRAEFLGAWRLTHDIGMFAGPVAVGAISALAVLGASAVGLALVAAVGAYTVHRWFPA